MEQKIKVSADQSPLVTSKEGLEKQKEEFVGERLSQSNSSEPPSSRSSVKSNTKTEVRGKGRKSNPAQKTGESVSSSSQAPPSSSTMPAGTKRKAPQNGSSSGKRQKKQQTRQAKNANAVAKDVSETVAELQGSIDALREKDRQPKPPKEPPYNATGGPMDIVGRPFFRQRKEFGIKSFEGTGSYYNYWAISGFFEQFIVPEGQAQVYVAANPRRFDTLSTYWLGPTFYTFPSEVSQVSTSLVTGIWDQAFVHIDTGLLRLYNPVISSDDITLYVLNVGTFAPDLSILIEQNRVPPEKLLLFFQQRYFYKVLSPDARDVYVQLLQDAVIEYVVVDSWAVRVVQPKNNHYTVEGLRQQINALNRHFLWSGPRMCPPELMIGMVALAQEDTHTAHCAAFISGKFWRTAPLSFIQSLPSRLLNLGVSAYGLITDGATTVAETLQKAADHLVDSNEVDVARYEPDDEERSNADPELLPDSSTNLQGTLSAKDEKSEMEEERENPHYMFENVVVHEEPEMVTATVKAAFKGFSFGIGFPNIPVPQIFSDIGVHDLHYSDPSVFEACFNSQELLDFRSPLSIEHLSATRLFKWQRADFFQTIVDGQATLLKVENCLLSDYANKLCRPGITLRPISKQFELPSIERSFYGLIDFGWPLYSPRSSAHMHTSTVINRICRAPKFRIGNALEKYPVFLSPKAYINALSHPWREMNPGMTVPYRETKRADKFLKDMSTYLATIAATDAYKSLYGAKDPRDFTTNTFGVVTSLAKFWNEPPGSLFVGPRTQEEAGSPHSMSPWQEGMYQHYNDLNEVYDEPLFKKAIDNMSSSSAAARLAQFRDRFIDPPNPCISTFTKSDEILTSAKPRIIHNVPFEDFSHLRNFLQNTQKILSIYQRISFSHQFAHVTLTYGACMDPIEKGVWRTEIAHEFEMGRDCKLPSEGGQTLRADVLVGGDDIMAVVHVYTYMGKGKAPKWHSFEIEGDITQCDQSHSALSLFLFRTFVETFTMMSFHDTFKTIEKNMQKNTDTYESKIKLLLTGMAETTMFNSCVAGPLFVLGILYGHHHSLDTWCSWFGFQVKVSYVPLGCATFHKGFWAHTEKAYKWVPLPSRLVKFGWKEFECGNTLPLLTDHLAGVASGWKSMDLDPVFGAIVWRFPSHKSVPAPMDSAHHWTNKWNWNRKGDILPLAACTRFYQHHYHIPLTDIIELVSILRKLPTDEALRIRSGLLNRIYFRDYRCDNQEEFDSICHKADSV